MSEQDLIGTSNVFSGSKIDRSLKYLDHLSSENSQISKKFAANFGYSYINYETWIMKKKYLNNFDFSLLNC